MKKSILSASIAAMIGGLGLAAVANAAVIVPGANVAQTLSINEAGTGHILVVPYFTTQGTNATLLNITNTDAVNGKAVKVRFRGASNSDDIFDFTLLMSPGDVWAAKVSQGADGVSKLETGDKTCTLPATVATQANSFPTNRLNSALSAADKAAQTREGYIEILTMADIPKAGFPAQAATVAAGTPSVNPLWTATKHVGGVAPCTAATLSLLAVDPVASTRVGAAAGNGGQDAVLDATTVDRPTTAGGMGLTFPTGQLMANWTIIDTVKTATFSGAAVALNAGLNATPNLAANANLVMFPQADTLVGAANINAFTADPLLRTESWRVASGATALSQATTATIAASMYDLPDLSTPYLSATTDARVQAADLTSKLAAKTVINEYLTTTSIAATTDWVFSMPTRRYNVALNYGYSNPLGGDGRVYTSVAGVTVPVLAAAGGNSTVTNSTFFSASNTAVADGKICVATNGPTSYDREETTTTTGFVISPGTVTVVRFCGETSVLGINNGSGTATGSMSATVAMQNLNLTTGNEGWLSIGTFGLSNATTVQVTPANPNDNTAGVIAAYNATNVSPSTVTAAATAAAGKGLPVLGAAFVKSSSFGAVWPHRFTR